MQVSINLYDLSMGMARSLSPMLLGIMVEFIPHTGLVVTPPGGTPIEIFYGGGIQMLPPSTVAATFGMSPVRNFPYPVPAKTFDQLRTFLSSIRPQFTPERYDLFNNNCNNFTSRCLEFLYDGAQTMPPRIMEIPSQVRTTPLGSMIAEMMGGMNARMGAAATADPFAALAAAAPPAFPAAAAPAAAPPPAPVAAPAAPVHAAYPVPPAPVYLPQCTKPLLSTDASGVGAVVTKLAKVNSDLPSDSPHRMTPTLEAEALACLPGLLATTAAAHLASPAPEDAAGAASMAVTCGLLTRVLRTWPRSTAAFPALAVLRVLALREDCIGHLTTRATIVVPPAAAAAASSPSATGEVVAAAAETLAARDAGQGGALWDVLETCHANHTMYDAAAANLMALSTLANALGTAAGTAWATDDSAVLGKLVDIACREAQAGLGSAPPAAASPAAKPLSRPETRQLAAALAFNIAVKMPDLEILGEAAMGDASALPEAIVQLLCGMLQDVDAESNEEALRRRLLAAGTLLHRTGPATANFVKELGLDEGLRAVAAKGGAPAASAGSPFTASPPALAADILCLLK